MWFEIHLELLVCPSSVTGSVKERVEEGCNFDRVGVSPDGSSSICGGFFSRWNVKTLPKSLA